MVMAAETSARLGWLGAAEVARVREIIARAGLPVVAPRIGVGRARELMALDKKVQGGRVRLVLLKGLGNALVTADYDPAALDAVLAEEVG
jgi:3-dehydroquinate synthase